MIGALWWAAAAWAAPEEVVLDLRQPGNVASALQRAGYKAEVKINKRGEPYVESATNGGPFSVEFYDCDGLKDCTSYQLTSWYKKEALFTPALANEWNARRRFLRVAIDGEGDLVQYLDATAVGGVTQTQFTELVQWYSDMDGLFARFVAEKREAAKAEPAKR